MKHYVLKAFICVVPVRTPTGGTQVNFHVAGARGVVADLDDRATKIRAAFDADESGMKNADNFSVGGFKPVAAEPLVLPDSLEEALGRQSVLVVQNLACGGLSPPGGIEIFGWRKHVPNFLRFQFVKVKSPVLI
jgi:hypothetical protein